MKNIERRCVVLFVLFFGIKISAGQNNISIYENKIYNKNIHTSLFHKEGNQLSYPIFHLDSEEKLVLSFDDFNTDPQDYYYTIVHCNSDWTKSDLMESEYIDGFFENRIEDYEFSFNTLQKYIHYNLIFPKDNLKPTLSGNYVIKVFLEIMD